MLRSMELRRVPLVATFVWLACGAPRPAEAGEAAPTPRPLTEIEARAKALVQPKDDDKDKDAAARFDAFVTWLGVETTCPSGACESIVSAKWISANVDADEGEEKVLAITTVGAGTCAPAHLEAIVFDVKDGLVAVGRAGLRIAAATAPTTEVVAATVHSPKVKDLILRVDGKCEDGDRAQALKVVTAEHGRLEEIAASKDFVGTGLVTHALTGAAPVTIRLTDASGTKELLFDEAAFAYDALPPYAAALKASVSKDDDDTLTTKQCEAPLGPTVALDCGLEGSAKVQVLVQHGRPTGLTISATPANAGFVRCMRKRVATMTWASVPGATGCVRTFKTKSSK